VIDNTMLINYYRSR